MVRDKLDSVNECALRTNIERSCGIDPSSGSYAMESRAWARMGSIGVNETAHAIDGRKAAIRHTYSFPLSAQDHARKCAVNFTSLPS